MMDVKKRKVIIQSLKDLNEAYISVQSSGEMTEEDSLKVDDLWSKIQEKMDDYRDVLDEVSVSRCPFTGQEIVISIDTVGLDGYYWNHEGPIRKDEDQPKIQYAMDGALRVSGEVATTDYLCAPGPDVPFVIPRLLAFEQIKCVVSSIKIGEHTGYIMMYYSSPTLTGELRINQWGTDRYYEDEAFLSGYMTPGQFISCMIDPKDYDYELAQWIKRGQLLWIDPEDPDLTLHSTVTGCPYLNLEGKRAPKYIIYGEVTYDEGFDEYLSAEEVDMDAYGAVIEAINKREGSEE